MKRILAFLFLLSSIGSLQHLQAQFLRCEGDIPDDLKMTVGELYQSDKQRAEQYAGGRVRDKQLLLEASYRINKMLAGGHIIYGDPVSRMVNRIADTLLKDYPQLRSELRFYTVTSPDVNAFTTPQGMIFINAGLVAQVEDEAQLAFIVAHEIIHYYRAHGMETLVGKNGKKKRTDDLDDEAEQAGNFTKKHARSREMENEADSLGIILFYLNSPYWKDVTEGVFDVLQYSELPFDDVPFDTTFFNTPYYQLTGCWLDTVASITTRDNYDDSRSTHPNILSRRQRTANALAGHAGGVHFLMTSQAEFDSLRHLARMECIRQDLIHGYYPRAFYNSWLLLQTNPQDENLHRFMSQALYGAAVLKCNDKYGDGQGDYNKIEGESQQVYYALHEMNAEQATLAALHRVWESHLRQPSNKEYSTMADHLMELLRTSAKKSATDYLDMLPVEKSDVADSSDEAEQPAKALTKYERIKQKRQTQTRRNPTSYALTDLMMVDSSLAPTLRTHLNGNAEKVPSTLKDDNSAMLVFNPSYWVVNKNEELQTSRSDKAESDLGSRIAKTSKRLGISTVDFSDQGMHNMTTSAQYNDFLAVCEWMNEFWLSKGTFEMQRLTQPAMDHLLARYDARTLTMTAILNNEGQDNGVSPAYGALIITLPFIVPAVFTGIEHTTMVSLVVDAHEGKMLTRQVYNYNVADHSALVDAMLYDTYTRVKKGAKPGKEPVGHLGHRLALAGGANLSLSGYQPMKFDHVFALTPWASAEFALTRKLSLTATARYHKGYDDVTQYYSGWREVTRYDYYGYPYQDYEHYEFDSVTSRSMLTLGLELRRYKNSDFAPYGYYFDFGLHMTRMTTLDKQHTDNTFGFHIGLGRNYILYHRLLLNYQIDYAYTYGLIKGAFGFEEETRPYWHYRDAILSNILTFKLGIGFIPF